MLEDHDDNFCSIYLLWLVGFCYKPVKNVLRLVYILFIVFVPPSKSVQKSDSKKKLEKLIKKCYLNYPSKAL